MWIAGLRAGCVVAVAVATVIAAASACSSFGIDTIVPDTDKDAAPPGVVEGGSTVDAGENCTVFKMDFEQGDLAANGFVGPVGNISVAVGSLVASVATVGEEVAASHASHEVELEQGAELDSVEVEFMLTLSALPSEGTLTFGCMLYARASRDRGQDDNQLYIQYDDVVRAHLESRIADTPKQDSSKELFPKEEMRTGRAVKARLGLAMTSAGVLGTVELDGKGLDLSLAPSADANPRLVSIQCGVPMAQTAVGKIETEVKIDDLSGKVCVTR